MKFISSFLLAVFVCVCFARADVTPDQKIEARINDLVSRMTLEEKLGQMSQTGFPHLLSDKVKDEIRAGRWGSFYGQYDPNLKAEMQHVAMNESRLNIPLIFGADLIHGFRTTFPIPLAQSCSWRPDLVAQAAHFTAIDAAIEGIHWTFAPMMDIGRDPRWGRIAETLGEDPFLSGTMASAMVQGFQGQSLSDPDSIAACGKHYAGYGAAEAGRDYNTTWIPEPLLHDVYLAPFFAAKNAGCASFMSAFNDLNGVPASGNAYILRDVLRKEWGFDGVVVSDYEAVKELIPHGYAADERDAARKGITAGVDMEMVSRTYFENGANLVNAGQLDPHLIDESVRNILRLKFRLGLFDAKGTRIPQRAKASPDALPLARELAEKSFVLLKNDRSALPLSKSINKLAIIGPLADSPRDQLGCWVADREGPAITPLSALRDRLGESHIIYAQGLSNSEDESHDGFADALAAARSADAVLIFLGEDAALSGEASSRSQINLPGAQEALVDELSKAGKPMIAVIMAGRPLVFEEVAKKMSAILWTWHPGAMAGPAITDTLFGDNVPSGKLTVTFPRNVGQIPIYYNHMNTGRPADDPGTAEKHYSSRYIDVDYSPEYPFGFGLSYTHFQYSNLRLSASQLKMGGALDISADVTNTGKIAADETAQLYIRQLAATYTQPVRELKAFTILHLQPGETKAAHFTLNSSQLSFHNAAGGLITEAGDFQAWIAPDSASGLQGHFQLIP